MADQPRAAANRSRSDLANTDRQERATAYGAQQQPRRSSPPAPTPATRTSPAARRPSGWPNRVARRSAGRSRRSGGSPGAAPRRYRLPPRTAGRHPAGARRQRRGHAMAAPPRAAPGGSPPPGRVRHDGCRGDRSQYLAVRSEPIDPIAIASCTVVQRPTARLQRRRLHAGDARLGSLAFSGAAPTVTRSAAWGVERGSARDRQPPRGQRRLAGLGVSAHGPPARLRHATPLGSATSVAGVARSGVAAPKVTQRQLAA